MLINPYQELSGKYRSMEFAVLRSNEKEKKSNQYRTSEPEESCINVNNEELDPKSKTGSFELELDYPDDPNFRIPTHATEDCDYPDDPNFRIPSSLPKSTEETDCQGDPNLKSPTLPKSAEDVHYPDNSKVLTTVPKATEEAYIPDEVQPLRLVEESNLQIWAHISSSLDIKDCFK